MWKILLKCEALWSCELCWCILYRLHGSYEAVEGGITMDALVDLTGGLAERYDVKEYDPTIYHLILHAHRSGAFIACAKKVIKKPTKKQCIYFQL